MKFTLSWLREHLETQASASEIAVRLTALGLEVEALENKGARLAPFKIAQIVALEKHPNADKLNVCVVDTGSEKIQVVCGAPNARVGLKSVLARPGDIIPREGTALKRSAIRGVESEGMLCSASELDLGEDSAGILDLPEDAPLGSEYAAWAGLDDPVFTLGLTPNRADAAGVLGIARDLAASGLGTLRNVGESFLTLSTLREARELKTTLPIRWRFTPGEESLCPLFTGRVIQGLRNGPSPAWLQHKLKAIGVRPISALVDITNYLTFDRARPLHVFDADTLKGGLWVGTAKGGETLVALNAVTYTLAPGMIVIGDDQGVQSLGGIIGGVATSCTDATTSVFLESALFDPVRIAQTGRALQITSDARSRFERGVDPASTLPGLDEATRLILEICGTPETTLSAPIILGSPPAPRTAIPYDPTLCARRLGVDVPPAEQRAILTALGCLAASTPEGQWRVTPPSGRPDIGGDVDLTEEIIRLKGYDAIPATPLPPSSTLPDEVAQAAARRSRRAGIVRRALAGQGLLEAVTWSMMSSALAESFGGGQEALRLVNPLSQDLDAARPSALPNLAQAAQRNADRGFPGAALFEVGPVYNGPSSEDQRLVAALVRVGPVPRAWFAAGRPVDAFDAKSDVLATLAAVGAPVDMLQVTADAPAWYHPGRSGTLRLGPVLLAHFGELHPGVLARHGLTAGPFVAAEIFLDAVPEPRRTDTAKPVLRLETTQPLTRDFAFVVDRAVPADKLVKTIKGVDKALIRAVTVFDVFEDDRLGTGKKSLALTVTLQPTDRALTDTEIEALSLRLITAATKATGATLRG